MDKLIYADTYGVIDKNFSFSNIGGRRGRNIRDHLLVIYGIINDVKNGKADAIDVQGYVSMKWDMIIMIFGMLVC